MKNVKNSLSFQNIFKRETKLASYIIVCMTIVVISLSYAMFFKVEGNSNNQEVVAGEFKFTYSNGTTITNANNAKCFLPYTADEASLVVTECSYQLNVQNTSALKANYTLSLVAQAGNALEATKLKVILKKQNGTAMDVVSGYPKKVSELTNNVLVTESLEPNETVVYSVQLYFDDTSFIDGDTSKAINYKIVGSGLVDEANQDVTTVPPTPATETITTLVSGANKSSTDVYTVPNKTSDSCTYTLAYDGTTDNNLRYVGSNPCNYVKIDNEIWRIIGVMNNIDDGTGKKESRIKLIRNESIGAYSWDSSSVNSGSGVNEWSQADLMKLLNPGYESESVGGSLYYNNGSGNCYIRYNNATGACDFTSSGLKTNLKKLIGNTLWHTGTNGTNDWKSASNGLASHFYSYERSSNNGKICTSNTNCNDTVTRTTTWNGKIGLMYPSDYGYATSGGTSMNRASCLARELYNWDSASDCYNNDWIYNSSNWQWTLSPSAASSYALYVFFVDRDGLVRNYVASAGFSYINGAPDASLVRPSVYLISKTSILGGDGTLENPYEIG